MIITVYEWPDNYIDHMLHRSRQQLPPLIYATERPVGIAWDEPLREEGADNYFCPPE